LVGVEEYAIRDPIFDQRGWRGSSAAKRGEAGVNVFPEFRHSQTGSALARRPFVTSIRKLCTTGRYERKKTTKRAESCLAWKM